MTDSPVLGPIDFILLEFPDTNLKGEMLDELTRLVESGTIRLYDLMVLSKDADGNAAALELDAIDGFAAFVDAQSGLLGDDDLSEAASAMEPGTVAAVLVYENTWAAPFVAAARRAGGELIASSRIPASDVLDVLDALESDA